MRGCDGLSTFHLDLGSQRPLAPTPTPSLECLSSLSTIPRVGAVCKDIGSRELCGVETTWMVSVAEPTHLVAS